MDRSLYNIAKIEMDNNYDNLKIVSKKEKVHFYQITSIKLFSQNFLITDGSNDKTVKIWKMNN